jgi:hypothetical protein
MTGRAFNDTCDHANEHNEYTFRRGRQTIRCYRCEQCGRHREVIVIPSAPRTR